MLLKTFSLTVIISISGMAVAQEHHSDVEHAARSGHYANDGPALTRTQDIESALVKGGEPIVADVLGVVCDFCALAMNKIFGKSC